MTFSSRLDWSLPENRLSRSLTVFRASGVPLRDLTVSNPTLAELSSYEALAREPFAHPASARYDPEPFGRLSAREAIAATYPPGAGVTPARVVLSTGTSEACSWLFKLLCDPGDEVLVPRPSYPLFEMLARLDGVRALPYSLRLGKRWRLDTEALESAAGPGTKAVLAVNPNNPTGSFLSCRDRDVLVRFAAARGAAIVCDEVFREYAFGDGMDGEEDPDRPGKSCRVETLAGETAASVFCLGGLSKSAALPQAKLSWIILPREEETCREAAKRLELVTDTYLTVGDPVQLSAPALLEAGRSLRAEITARVHANLDAMRRLVAGTEDVRLIEPEGGWNAVVQVPGRKSDEEWALALLERDGVLVQPGYFYDFESSEFLVVSLLTPPGTFREGIEALVRRCGRSMRRMNPRASSRLRGAPHRRDR